MRLCVIGNSHVAALKTGWDAAPDLHGLANATFFGAIGRQLGRLRREGSRFKTDDPAINYQLQFTSGGLTDIQCDDFDAFVTAGLYFGRTNLIPRFELHRISGFPGRSKFDHLVSKEMMDSIVTGSIRSCLAVTLAKRLRRVTSKPVIICEQPLPSAHIIKRSDNYWSDAAYFERLLRKRWIKETRRIRRQGILILEQPVETINRKRFLTHHRFSAGAIRMLEGMNRLHKKREYAHMNALYGAIVMREIIKALGSNVV